MNYLFKLFLDIFIRFEFLTKFDIEQFKPYSKFRENNLINIHLTHNVLVLVFLEEVCRGLFLFILTFNALNYMRHHLT